VEIRFSPLQGPKGLSITAAIRDITERRKAEMRFRALLESAPDAMVIVNAAGIIELANLQAEKLFQYSRMELLGKSVDVLVPSSLRGAHAGYRGEFFAAPRKREMGAGRELMAVRKDGSEFPVEISLSPLESAEGISVTAAIRDVTERKQAAALLAQTIAELRHSNEALEQFAHVASHDLQEPLRMVASFTQLLSKRYKGRLDADADEFIHYAVDGTQRMKRMIEDLLQYSRAGKGDPPEHELQVEAVLREAMSNLRAAIEESGAQVTWDPMPQVLAPESQLVQIFQNLIGNAIKYRGKEAPHVHIEARSLGQAWQFSVSDNGIGIEEKSLEKIFLIFHRLHGRGEFEGNGVGLAICKQILQQRGGKIWAESNPGQGSTFHFVYPIKSAHE
jgi:PAS domain S-box-containing protein